MDKFKYNLIAMLSTTITAIKSADYARQTAIVLSSMVLPITVHAAVNQNRYETYVIHTYGGNALLPAVRQQLNNSRDGGTVTTYQDKLVLRTTSANYQAVQQLLTQIDRQPQALTVAVRVGKNSSAQGNIQQGQVIITNRGIQGSGIINQRSSQQQGSSLYQVQTLSGSAASIDTSTLWSLAQSYYPITSTYSRPIGRIVIQQQVLLPTTQGISVIPRLLPNGQVEVTLSQVEERLVRPKSSYNRQSVSNNRIQGQSLNSTIIIPRGQWVNIGQISQSSRNQSTSYGSNRVMNNDNSVPISLLVQ
ncbi:hypothetical protein [Psychrobacter aquaticus]|uniref:Type II and III secretion system family protein n=1 Tax=Psychrobacter aquaticus CMS 56 TaxID=1354303 RepID=U4T5F2_9GAMM|nr:hypothetical protein [Psychrobacter aquaticus]ERL56577.1 hypothetical protein M917_0603 [Psychrobacter aquaticus CMS 56]